MSDELRKAMDSMLAEEPPYPEDLGDRALRRGRTVLRRRFAAVGTALAVLLAGAIALPAVLQGNAATLEVAGTGEVTTKPVPPIVLPPAPTPTGSPTPRPTGSAQPEAPASSPPSRSPAALAAATYDSLPETPMAKTVRSYCAAAASTGEAPQVFNHDQYTPQTRRPPFATMRLLHSVRDDYGISAVFLARDGEVAMCSLGGGYHNNLDGATVYSHQQRYGEQSASTIRPHSLNTLGGLVCTPEAAQQLDDDCDQRWLHERSGLLPPRVTRMTVTFPGSGRTVEAEIRHGVWLVRHVEYVGPESFQEANRPTFRLYDDAGKLLLTHRQAKGVG